jgi:hypothetical protein
MHAETGTSVPSCPYFSSNDLRLDELLSDRLPRLAASGDSTFNLYNRFESTDLKAESESVQLCASLLEANFIGLNKYALVGCIVRMRTRFRRSVPVVCSTCGGYLRLEGLINITRIDRPVPYTFTTRGMNRREMVQLRLCESGMNLYMV